MRIVARHDDDLAWENHWQVRTTPVTVLRSESQKPESVYFARQVAD